MFVNETRLKISNIIEQLIMIECTPRNVKLVVLEKFNGGFILILKV